MGRRVKIPLIGGSKYHAYGGRYTMVREVKLQWVREIKISWVIGSKYRGEGFKIPWVSGTKRHG